MLGIHTCTGHEVHTRARARTEGTIHMDAHQAKLSPHLHTGEVVNRNTHIHTVLSCLRMFVLCETGIREGAPTHTHTRTRTHTYVHTPARTSQLTEWSEMGCSPLQNLGQKGMAYSSRGPKGRLAVDLGGHGEATRLRRDGGSG